MNDLKEYETWLLPHILHDRIVISREFSSAYERFKAVDEEFDRRFAERGEFVRCPMTTKTKNGDAFVCAKMVDDVILGTYYEYDEAKVKDYRILDAVEA